ncbi:mechanosensitive ion channel family protein [Francisellaceae bacterium]|nr:mechanosensitive ion channel family protein [Francisellaceae bacterium]
MPIPSNLIDQKLSLGVINTIILTIIIIFTYFISRQLIKRKVDSHTRARRYILRAFYIIITIYAILFIRIWVDGLSSIFTVLGLVSAGLVISNKENIMNLVGGLIILWRGLFIESNLIKIRNYEGYISKIGPMYFTIYQHYNPETKKYSGQITRIPNGWVITDAVTNYSHSIVIIEDHLNFKISSRNEYPILIEGAKKILDQLLKLYCKKAVNLSTNTDIIQDIVNSSAVSISPDIDNIDQICINLKYKCSYLDSEEFKDKLSFEITKLLYNKEIFGRSKS